MEKYQHMKEFVSGASEYLKNKLDDELLTGLQRCLKILCISPDLSIFDPGSSMSTEFFVSLHKLMSGQKSRSSVLWCGINLLQRVCQNPAARAGLIHTYRFTPILSKLLGAHLIYEKKLKVLNLLQELTYGVKISWLMTHLRNLIPVLTQMIEGSEKEVAELALGVLANLCYKNILALYLLVRTVDIKQFLNVILKVQNVHMNTRFQQDKLSVDSNNQSMWISNFPWHEEEVCKLLIAMENISGEVPDILNFTTVTFSTLGEAFKSNNVFFMRHIVDFFQDVQSNEHYHQMLFKYKTYVSDTEDLLKLIDNSSSDECVGMLFEFFDYLITLEVPGMEGLYLDIVSKAMNWFHNPSSCTQSLQLVCSVTMEVRKMTLNHDSTSNEFKLCEHINVQLDNSLEALLMLLDIYGNQNFFVDSGIRTRLTAIMQLLQEICQTLPLKQKIMASLNVQVVKKVFAPLLNAELCGGADCPPELVALYVHTLDFVSGLVPHDSTWLSCYLDLLNHHHVQMVLAMALHNGPAHICHKVLTLIATRGFSADSLSLLAKRLCHLEPLVQISSNQSKHVATRGYPPSSAVPHNMKFLFSLVQEQRLDRLITQLEGLAERNEIQDMAALSVMELYEYKLVVMSHSEQTLMSSLEAANDHVTHLQHREAQLVAEVGKHHQLLYHSQQCIVGLREEKAALLQRLQESQAVIDKSHTKLLEEMNNRKTIEKELTNTIEDMRMAFALEENELQSAKKNIEALHNQEKKLKSQYNYLERNHEKLTMKSSELTKLKSKLEKRISMQESVIQDRECMINECRKENNALKTERDHLNVINKMYEKTIQEKDSELEKTSKHVKDLERMRNNILKISSGQEICEK